MPGQVVISLPPGAQGYAEITVEAGALGKTGVGPAETCLHRLTAKQF